MKWPLATVAALVTFGVITCGGPVSEEDLPNVYADNYCRRAKQCDPNFDDRWDNRADCEDDMENIAETFMGLTLLFCDYDPAGGRDCIRAINEGNCADFLDNDAADDIECNICE